MHPKNLQQERMWIYTLGARLCSNQGVEKFGRHEIVSQEQSKSSTPRVLPRYDPFVEDFSNRMVGSLKRKKP